jgi:hypothetical protein
VKRCVAESRASSSAIEWRDEAVQSGVIVSPASHSPPLADLQEHPADWWLEAVKREERRGELLAAFDYAERGLDEHPQSLALKHRAVLSLARTGATEEAAARYERYGLGQVADEDIAALGARIAKDAALAHDGPERRRLAASAASLYGAIFERTGGYYPAINGATLWLLAGSRERASRLARTVLEVLAAGDERSYWAAATAAEAHLLLGDTGQASRALERAAALHDGDYTALATTRRQLRTICTLQAIDPSLLRVLAGPSVVHFCGHRIAAVGAPGGLAAHDEAAVQARIAEVVAECAPGFAYGSLASGADILWAEALLAGGTELHIVLPFARAEFVEWSVAPAGPAWVERFDRCLRAANSIRFATDDAYLGDDVLFRYAAELAMGLALLRARYLDAEVRQLTVWDRQPSRGAAGTAVDVATWLSGDRAATLVAATADVPRSEAIQVLDRGLAPAARLGSSSPPPAHRAQPKGRVLRAMLFGDVRGFSVLTDEQLPVFADRVFGALAAALLPYREHVWHVNTWGDAIFLVVSDAPAAAACALGLQDAMASIDLRAEGLPDHLALRLGGHLGPVFPYRDPVVERSDFIGSHVSRTARIEPVTPAGAVYVTEPFAAALVLSGQPDLACDYVGHMPAAKAYGRLRMYRLRRRPRAGVSTDS